MGQLSLWSLRCSTALAALALISCGNAEQKQAEEAVRSFLKDPDSAQFRNLREASGGICGEYNAKNAMGGYVGYRPFKWARKTGYIVTVDDDNRIMRLDAPSEEMFQSVTMEFYCGASQ